MHLGQCPGIDDPLPWQRGEVRSGRRLVPKVLEAQCRWDDLSRPAGISSRPPEERRGAAAGWRSAILRRVAVTVDQDAVACTGKPLGQRWRLQAGCSEGADVGPSYRLAKAKVSARPSTTRTGVSVSQRMGLPRMSTAPWADP